LPKLHLSVEAGFHGIHGGTIEDAQEEGQTNRFISRRLYYTSPQIGKY
jgi:hypothetical protein